MARRACRRPVKARRTRTATPARRENEGIVMGEFEEKWINGDCAVPGFASLDGLFKRLMEGGEA